MLLVRDHLLRTTGLNKGLALGVKCLMISPTGEPICKGSLRGSWPDCWDNDGKRCEPPEVPPQVPS